MNPTPHDIEIFIILEEERISISFLIGDHPNNWPLTEMTGLMEILGLEEYFKTKVTLSLTNWFSLFPFQLESMEDNNWRDSFNLPKQKATSNQSNSLSSPTNKSIKSYALLNSPVSSSQRRHFDRSERDRYFPIAQKLNGKHIFSSALRSFKK